MTRNYNNNDLTTPIVTGTITDGNMHPIGSSGALGTNNNSGVNNMRRVINLNVIDEDKGLPVEHSLVVSFKGIVTEDDNEVTIREAIMEAKTYDKQGRAMRKILEEHNTLRNSIVNEDILERTGHAVMLRSIKLKNLRFEIV